MDEGAPSPSVAVDEGVDRLELRMSDRRLRDCRERVVVGEGAEILEQDLHVLGGRRDERSRARVVAAPADPVLHRADRPGVLAQTCSTQ